MGNAYRTPTTTTTPVNGTTAGLFTFANSAVTVYMQNSTGQAVYLLFNGGNTRASTTVHDRQIANGGNITIDAIEEGLLDVTTVSVWMPTGATETGFLIRGV